MGRAPSSVSAVFLAQLAGHLGASHRRHLNVKLVSSRVGLAVKGAEHNALAGVVVKLDRQWLVPGLGGGQVQRVVGPGPWLEDSDERLGKLHGVLRPLAVLAAKSCTGCKYSQAYNLCLVPKSTWQYPLQAWDMDGSGGRPED